MSTVFSLSESLPPDLDLPPNVHDYVTRLKTLAESQQRELNFIREKNQRLEDKLKTMETYNEELREQVKATVIVQFPGHRNEMGNLFFSS